MTLEAPAPFDPGAALLSRAEATRAAELRRPTVQTPSVLDLQHAMGSAGTVEEARRTLRGEVGTSSDHGMIPRQPRFPLGVVGPLTDVGLPGPGPFQCLDNSLDVGCPNVVQGLVTMSELLPVSVGGTGPWVVGHVFVGIVPGAEVCQRTVDLVLAALRMLERFTEPDDIIGWMVCLLNAAECDMPLSNCVPGRYLEGFNLIELQRYFHGVAPYSREVRVSLNPWLRGRAQTQEASGRNLAEIQLAISDISFTNLVYAWEHGSETEQMCAVLRLSTILLHEFLHVLRLPQDGNHPNPSDVAPDPVSNRIALGLDDQCNPWNLIPNLYLYAARRRLGWAAAMDAWPCCSEPGGPATMFMINSASCWAFMLPDLFPPGTGRDDFRMCTSGMEVQAAFGVDVLCPDGRWLQGPHYIAVSPRFDGEYTEREVVSLP